MVSLLHVAKLINVVCTGVHVIILLSNSFSLSYIVCVCVCSIDTDIAEEEKLLSDLIVVGTKLVSMIEDVVSDSERLTSIAGNEITSD